MYVAGDFEATMDPDPAARAEKAPKASVALRSSRPQTLTPFRHP